MTRYDDLIRRGDAETLIYDLLAGEPAKDKWSDVGKRIADIPAVPREMTAREFVSEQRRMHNTYFKNGCYHCPLLEKGRCLAGLTNKTIEAVEQWAKEHPEKPRKTYAEDFFEKFPKCEKAECIGDVIPALCRKSVYGGKPLKGCDQGRETCVDCWNEPMPEEDENE